MERQSGSAATQVFSGLTFLFCGRRGCAPEEEYGPAMREQYVLYFCAEGQGTCHLGERSYILKAGEGVLACPGVMVSLRADSRQPWTLVWVGLRGDEAPSCLDQCGLGGKQPLFSCDQPRQLEQCVAEMMEADRAGWSARLFQQGLLCRFLSLIVPPVKRGRGRTPPGERYVEQAMAYIRQRYQENITVAGMAEYVGLNRSYLTTVFQTAVNRSPQQVLMDYRMEQAVRMLREGRLSVGEVARSCGYEDPLTFSKAFKRSMGVAPAAMRGQKSMESAVKQEPIA